MWDCSEKIDGLNTIEYACWATDQYAINLDKWLSKMTGQNKCLMICFHRRQRPWAEPVSTNRWHRLFNALGYSSSRNLVLGFLRNDTENTGVNQLEIIRKNRTRKSNKSVRNNTTHQKFKKSPNNSILMEMIISLAIFTPPSKLT